MWSNWKDRIKEIEDEIHVLGAGGFPQTAQRMAPFVEKLAHKTAPDNLVSELEDILDTFRGEFRGAGAFRDRLLRTVEPILNFMITRFGTKQEKYVSFFQDLSRAAKNIEPIGRAFLPFPPGKVRYYGMCLIYLVHAEGIFARAVAILYGMTLEALNLPITVSKLNNMSVEEIRNEFVKVRPSSKAIFEGWEEGHIRNAIAHSRFYYDDRLDVMYFEDFNIKTGKITYPKSSFTIEQFSELSIRLEDVWHLVSHLILMARFIRLVGFPDVPDAGKVPSA